MQELVKGTTRGGDEWIPNFISTLDQEKCLGCARCFKVCGREALVPLQLEDEDEDDPRMVIEIANPDNCIGCEACGKVCAKKCHTYKYELKGDKRK